MLSSPPLIPLGPRAFLSVTGPDALRFLNGQLTNDIAQADDNRSVAAAALNAKGGLEAICCVHKIPDGYLLDAPVELKETLPERLDRYLIADEVIIEDASESWSVAHALEEKPTHYKGPLLIRSCARFGLDGFDLIGIGPSPPESECSIEASEWEHQRIELGIPVWGRELTSGLLPAEAGLDTYMVSFGKGCYLGQEVISRMKRAGKTNRQLIKFTVPDDVRTPSPIYHNGKVAGEITSVSPLGGVALGFRKRSAAGVVEFSLEDGGGGEMVRVRG